MKFIRFLCTALIVVALGSASTAASANAPMKSAKRGTLAVTVSGTGTFTITGEGVTKTGQASESFKLKPGTYAIAAAGGTVDRASVKLRKGKTVRVTVTFASNTNGGGSGGGIPAGEYTCYGGGTFSTFWIDSASKYRDASGDAGTYRLDTATTAISKGGIKIDWLTGTYAEWQKESPPYWAEFVPVGTVGASGTPSTVPTILTTFDPKYTGVWTTCTKG